ncbi:MAG TPA: GTP pyrophosphokinase family protein [Bacillota bacterium]|nr:GTP pyrophosphokinase family protein [Bacillota bacterium]
MTIKTDSIYESTYEGNGAESENAALKTVIERLGGNAGSELISQAKPFIRLMTQYQCAMLEVKTKFEVLNAEMSLDSEKNPFESISCRLKKPASILDKLYRGGYEPTVENIEEHIRDVAGIRVICSFPDDIYMLADKLVAQDDITLIQRKDYIASPKPNGYRSLHLIVGIPIFLSNEKKEMFVEVQMRTIAMDFWASLEHKLRYKKDIKDPAAISDKLRECAEQISDMDARMQEIRDLIIENKL